MLCLEAGPSSVGLLRSFVPGFPATLRSWWSHVGAVPKLSPSPQTSSPGTETRNRWTETIGAELQNNAVGWVSIQIRFLNFGGESLLQKFKCNLWYVPENSTCPALEMKAVVWWVSWRLLSWGGSRHRELYLRPSPKRWYPDSRCQPRSRTRFPGSPLQIPARHGHSHNLSPLGKK